MDFFSKWPFEVLRLKIDAAWWTLILKRGNGSIASMASVYIVYMLCLCLFSLADVC